VPPLVCSPATETQASIAQMTAIHLENMEKKEEGLMLKFPREGKENTKPVILIL
jgi:hypothetical protein